MKTKLSAKLLIILYLLFSISGIAHAVTLQNGVTLHVSSLPSMNIIQYDFSVPASSSSMTVTISNGSGDLDLYIKYGSPITGNNISEIQSSADTYTTSTSANESITLNSSSSPVLQSGTWYIAVVNWNQTATSFDLLASVTATVSTTGGIPAGALIFNQGTVTALGMNFSNDFELKDVQDLNNLLMPLITKFAPQGLIEIYNAELLVGLGYTGDSLHNYAVSELSLAHFNTYYQANITKVTGTLGVITRVEVNQWDSQYPTGQFMAGIEIAEKLPLMELLGLMSTGTRYIKIKTVESTTVAGTKYIRMEFYYQETTSSESLFIATVEITELLLQNVFASLQTSS
jgi:Bacterial pre-peptidase C-terminal domain